MPKDFMTRRRLFQMLAAVPFVRRVPVICRRAFQNQAMGRMDVKVLIDPRQARNRVDVISRPLQVTFTPAWPDGVDSFKVVKFNQEA